MFGPCKSAQSGQGRPTMRRFLLTLFLLAALLAGLVLLAQRPIEQTTEAALKAYPVYSFVRVRDETLLRARHEGVAGANRLQHRPNLAGPRDRVVTTPNNDTLYSSAFLDLAAGPVVLTMPALPGRYHSVAVMDARTDNVLVTGTRDGGRPGRLVLAYGPQPIPAELSAPDVRVHRLTTPEAWLLVRILVEGPADLDAARAAQSGFVLDVPPASRRPDRPADVRPVLPDPATLLAAANPLVAESPHLAAPALAATGYGQAPGAFEALPLWRQWLWRLLMPRLYERIRMGLHQGARTTGDGWSRTPPGIGTADAPDTLRSAVALAGLGALPADEAVYWSAVIDSRGNELSGARAYRLTIPADVPARAFWSLSMYERLPDGRLFYVDNPIARYAVGDRVPDLARNPDGSLTLTIAARDPGPGSNWLPAPAGKAFTLIFRAYLPEEPILSGRWRLPPVEPLTP